MAQRLGWHSRRFQRPSREPAHLKFANSLHELGAVRVKPVPDDDQRLADLAAEIAQGGNHLLGVDAAPEVAGVQSGRSIERRDQGDDAGDLPASAQPPQDGGRPRRARWSRASPKGETCLVHEGNGAPGSASPFLTRGHSRLSHAVDQFAVPLAGSRERPLWTEALRAQRPAERAEVVPHAEGAVDHGRDPPEGPPLRLEPARPGARSSEAARAGATGRRQPRPARPAGGGAAPGAPPQPGAASSASPTPD